LINHSSNKLKQRRQRNLTTSFRTNYTDFVQPKADLLDTFSSSANKLDKFIDSLEDINNYLEKKLSENSSASDKNDILSSRPSLLTSVTSTQISCIDNKKLRRHFTQPIFYGSNYSTTDNQNIIISNTNSSTNLNNNNNNNENKITMMIEEINNSKLLSSSIKSKFQSSHSNKPNNSTAATKKNDEQSSLPKKFVSLSDILNNEKHLNCLDNSSLVPIKQTTKASEYTGETVKEQVNLHNQPSQKTIQQSINDLLTVQELFEELELDCDEQIKQLDEIERKRKENTNKQKKIVDEIKLKCINSPHLFKLNANNSNNGFGKLNLNNLSTFAYQHQHYFEINNKNNNHHENAKHSASSSKLKPTLARSFSEINKKLDKSIAKNNSSTLAIAVNGFKNSGNNNTRKLIRFDLIKLPSSVAKEATAASTFLDKNQIYFKFKTSKKYKKCIYINLLDNKHLSIYFENYLFLIDYLTSNNKCLFKFSSSRRNGNKSIFNNDRAKKLKHKHNSRTLLDIYFEKYSSSCNIMSEQTNTSSVNNTISSRNEEDSLLIRRSIKNNNNNNNNRVLFVNLNQNNETLNFSKQKVSALFFNDHITLFPAYL
jgi:hypothetical protein